MLERLAVMNRLVLITGIALGALGCESNTPNPAPEVQREVLARVNGEAIYGSDFRQELSAVRVDDPEGSPIGLADMVQLRNLLNDQVERRLLLQAARKRKLQ